MILTQLQNYDVGDESEAINLEQLINQLSDFSQLNEISDITEVIDKINIIYAHDDNFSISSYIELSHLQNTLIQTLDNHYITSIFNFYVNLTYNLTDSIITFFTSSEFSSFLEYVLTNLSTKEVLEFSFLIFTNTLLSDTSLCIQYIMNGIPNLFSQIKSEEFIILERKSYFFSLFLRCNLNDDERNQSFILNEIYQILNSHFDSIKCYALKGLIKANKSWSNIISDFLKTKSILPYLCEVLKKYNSLKLSRYILTFMLKLIKSDEEFLKLLIQSDLQSCVQKILEINEDRCSSLCIDIYKYFVLHKDICNDDLNFSFLLTFQNKGFIAKIKCVEFISWIYEKKFDIYLNFDDSEKQKLMHIVDDIAQSGDEDIYSCIIKLFLCIKESELGDFLLSLLANNKDFKFFLGDFDEKQEYVYIMSKIDDFLKE